MSESNKWLRDGRTVFALNDKGTNRFSCHVMSCGPDSDNDETLETYARLIAAAPELLAACEEVLESCQNEIGLGGQCCCDIELISKAIAKARGI